MRRKLTLVCALTILAIAGGAMADGTFMIMPGFNSSFFPGTVFSSADGSVLGGSWGGMFLYTDADGRMPIDDTVGASSYSLSGDGTKLAVSFEDPDGLGHAGYWSAAEGFVLVDATPDGAPCGSDLSSAYALNQDGSVLVGLQWVGCEARAFKWTAGAGSVNLGASGGSSRATSVSLDGTTTVGFDEHPDMGFRRPAIWTDDVVGPQLVAGEDAQGEFYDVSSDGTKGCGVLDGQAMYWDTTVGAVSIGALPGDEDWGATAFAISDDGVVVGMSGNQFFTTPRAFIWTFELGMMSLADYLVQEGVAGYEDQLLNRAIDISADGTTITGAANNSAGFGYVPFVVRLLGSVATDPTEDPQTDVVPPLTALVGAYPNPFNPTTTVKFSLEHAQPVRLSVYDAAGRLVSTLVDGVMGAGEQQVVWRGTDATGSAASSGTYLLMMETEDGVRTSKAMLVR